MSSFDRDATWANPDGLKVGFGTRSVQTNTLVVSGASGAKKSGYMVIDYSGLEDTDSVTAAGISEQSYVIPRGSLITDANFVVHTAFAGATATLDIGTYDSDLSSIAADDADGIDVDIAVTAIDAVGDTIQCDGALVNAAVLCGATSNSDVVVVAAYQTAAFTAGRGVLYLEWQEPGSGNRTLAV